MKNFTPYLSMKKLVLALCLQLLFISGFTQVQVVAGGIGQTDANPNNAANGGAATGLGCGGGGANFYGGNGGDGMFGGGGGGAAGFTAPNMIGGAGGQGVVVVAFYTGGSFLNTIVYETGTSLTVGPLVTSVKVWTIGAGGGGAGGTDNDGTVGGGGGAGGIAFTTQAVTPGDIITYSLGIGGAGGIDANNGSDGTNTTAIVAGTTITGNGGSGGQYNNGTDAAGGSFTGGDGGANGGDGIGSAGDTGGGGGGGIGVAPGNAPSGGDGASGADAADVSGLFAALSSGILLPVTWESFSVTNQKSGALLQWKTSFELNAKNFTIQYSTDGINYSNIAQVAAANNTNGNLYSYLHTNPLPVTGYYRLCQTDINGKKSFSGIVKNVLSAAKENDFVLNTTVITNSRVLLQVNKTSVFVLSAFDGRSLFSGTMQKGVNTIDVSKLAKGYYILHSANQSQKIMIQ